MNVSPKNEHIPRATIQRLATYLQVLEAMHKEGVQVISSEPLSRACDVNASQVRKDLAYFGEFGVRGVGYYVSYLLEAIKVCQPRMAGSPGGSGKSRAGAAQPSGIPPPRLYHCSRL